MPTVLIDWEKIRDEVYKRLAKEHIISVQEIIEWVKKDDALPETYTKMSYTIIRMIVNGKPFPNPADETQIPVTIQSVKVHPTTNEKVSSVENGWLVLGDMAVEEISEDGSEMTEKIKERLKLLYRKLMAIIFNEELKEHLLILMFLKKHMKITRMY